MDCNLSPSPVICPVIKIWLMRCGAPSSSAVTGGHTTGPSASVRVPEGQAAWDLGQRHLSFTYQQLWVAEGSGSSLSEPGHARSGSGFPGDGDGVGEHSTSGCGSGVPAPP